MLPAFLTTILFSLSAVSARRTADIMGGIEANFWRLAMAAVLLGTWAHSFGLGLRGEALPYFLLSGCVGFGVGDLALFQALPRLGSRLTVMLVHCLAAPLAALAEWWWLGTTLSVQKMACGAVILAGVVIALAPGEHLQWSSKKVIQGILFGLLAACGQGGGAVISRKANQVAVLAAQNVDGITAAYQRILAGLALAGLFLILVKWRGRARMEARDPGLAGSGVLSARERWRRGGFWILLNALAGPSLGVSCFQWALKTTPTGVVLPIVATTPLVVIPFTLVLEGERPSRTSIVGGVIAVIGAVALASVR